MPRSLVVLDTSYTWRELKQRGSVNALLSRDLDGFFECVWSVHPFASKPGASTGNLTVTRIDDRHVIVEGGTSLPGKGSLSDYVRFASVQARLLGLLIRLIRQQGIAAVRVGDPYYLGLLGLAAARCTNTPLVVRVAGNFEDARRITGKPAMPRLFKSVHLERIVERFVLRRADWVFAPNLDNLTFAVRAGAAPARSSIVRYGNLLADEFSSVHDPEVEVTQRSLLGDTHFVLVVSRLEPIKRVDHAIRAFAETASLSEGLELWIAGDGSQRPKLEVLARDLGVEDRVRFLGTASQRWLADAYRECDVFLSPQAGRALSEAALSGAAIVGYESDWQGELIEDGYSGILVPDGDWRELGQALTRLVFDRDTAQRIGGNVRQSARAILSRDACVAAERLVYANALEGRRR